MSKTYRRKTGFTNWPTRRKGDDAEMIEWRIKSLGLKNFESYVGYIHRDGKYGSGSFKECLKWEGRKHFRSMWRKHKNHIMKGDVEAYHIPQVKEYGNPWNWS